MADIDYSSLDSSPDNFAVPASAYSTEKNLSIAIGNPEMPEDKAKEQNPAYDDELDKEIERASNPKVKQILQDEKTRRQSTKASKPAIDYSGVDSIDFSGLDKPEEDPSVLDAYAKAGEKLQVTPEEAATPFKTAGQRLAGFGEGAISGIAGGFYQLGKLAEPLAHPFGLGEVLGSYMNGTDEEKAKIKQSVIDYIVSTGKDVQNATQWVEKNLGLDSHNAEAGRQLFSIATGGPAIEHYNKKLVSMIDPQYQEAAQQLLGTAEFAALLKVGAGKKGAKAKAPEEAPKINPDDLQADFDNANPTGPSAPGGGGADLSPKAKKAYDKMIADMDRQGKNPYFGDTVLPTDKNGMPYRGDLSSDIHEATNFQQNLVDEGGKAIPDEAQWRQTDMFEDPQKTADALLAEAQMKLAGDEYRASKDPDTINQQQEALWQLQEANERAKAEQQELLWRDYEADNIKARIPALKEFLEGPRKEITFPEEIPDYPTPANMIPEDQAILRMRAQVRATKGKPSPEGPIKEPIEKGSSPMRSDSAMARQRGAIDTELMGKIADFIREGVLGIPKDYPGAKNGVLEDFQRRSGQYLEGSETAQKGPRSVSTTKDGLEYPELSTEALNQPKTDTVGRPLAMDRPQASEGPFRFRGAGFRNKNTGEITPTGPVHLMPRGMKAADVEPGFIGSDGKFYTRQEAEAKTGQGANLFKGLGAKQGGAIDISWLGDLVDFAKKIAKRSGDKINDVLAVDNRNGEQFANDTLKKLQSGEWSDKKTVHQQSGLSTGTFRSLNSVISDPKNVWKQVQHFVNKKIFHAVAELHAMDQAATKSFKEFYNYYNKAGIKGIYALDVTKFKQDLAIALKMEGGEGWFDGTNYIPKVSDLVAQGMSQESAVAWNKLHTVMGTVWDNLSKAANIAGRRMPDRVAGYLPHVWQGPYKVRVFKKGPNGENILRTFDAWTEREAQNFADQMSPIAKKNGYEVSPIERPQASRNAMATLFDGLWEAKSRSEKNKALQSLYENLFESQAQGIVTSVLDRAKMPQLGHMLERAASDGPFALNEKRIADAMQVFEDTAKAANNWYNKVKFANEVLFPMDMKGMFKDPHVRTNVQNWIKQFMGTYNAILPDADSFFRSIMINKGLDPAIPSKISQGMTSTFAKLYLVGKPAYYLANRFQSTMTLSQLYLTQALNGGKGSVRLAYKNAMADLWDAQKGEAGKATNPLLARGLREGYIAPSFLEGLEAQLRPGLKDPISKYIEETTRAESYAIGYHFFKQFMKDEDAFKAAGEFADRVSVPYSTTYGAPNLLSRLPAMIKPLAMFATYNQHMLGMVGAQARTFLKGIETKDNRMAAKAAQSLIVGQSINGLLFGFGGFTYAQNWNDIARKLSDYLGWNMPTTQEMARKLGEIDPTADRFGQQVAEHGLVGLATNIEVANSGMGASFQMPNATASMAGALLSLAAVVAKAGLTLEKPTADDIYQSIKNTTPQISGPAKYMLRAGGPLAGAELWWKAVQGEVKDYTVNKHLNDPGIEMTPWESALAVTGGKSPRLQEYQTSEQIYNKQQTADATKVRDAMSHILTPGPKSPEEYKTAIEAIQQVNPTAVKSILAKLKSNALSQSTPQLIAEMLKSTNSERSLYLYNLKQKIRQGQGLQ